MLKQLQVKWVSFLGKVELNSWHTVCQSSISPSHQTQKAVITDVIKSLQITVRSSLGGQWKRVSLLLSVVIFSASYLICLLKWLRSSAWKCECISFDLVIPLSVDCRPLLHTSTSQSVRWRYSMQPVKNVFPPSLHWTVNHWIKGKKKNKRHK